MEPAILLVDDDVELAELLRDFLVGDGFEVGLAHTGTDGVIQALSGAFALVVLDVMMPGLDGMRALQQIRTFTTVPVLMLTARGDDADRIAGLERGADDYLAKPCNPRELAARIRAILWRSGLSAHTPPKPLSAGALTLWPASRQVQLCSNTLELTHTEFSLLEVLARNAGRLVSKADLTRQALARPFNRFDRSVDVHISRIRQKMGPLPDGREYIQTVVRQGYQLVLE